MKSFRTKRLLVRFFVYVVVFTVIVMVIMAIAGQLNGQRDILMWLVTGVLYGIGMTIFEVTQYKVSSYSTAKKVEIISQIKKWGFVKKPYNQTHVTYFERPSKVRGFARGEEFYLFDDGNDNFFVEGLKKYMKKLK